jgi:ATP-dependent DNA ligase
MTALWTYAPMLAKPSSLQGDLRDQPRKVIHSRHGVQHNRPAPEGVPVDIVAKLDRYFADHDFELKMDGVRAMLEFDGHTVRVLNRKGDDIAERVPDLVQSVLDAKIKPFILDGEIVLRSALADDREKRTGFTEANRRIAAYRKLTATARAEDPTTFVAFDCLRYSTRDFVGEHVVHTERSAMARVITEVIENVEPVMRNVSPILWSLVIAEGWEGIIIKRRTGLYVPGHRGDEWLKLKAETTLTCWAIGYDESDKVGRDVGAIHVAVMDNAANQPFYVGRVGSGITADEQAIIRAAIDAKTYPLIEVRCNGRSADRLRFPVYLGRRDDLTNDDVSTRNDFEFITKAV